MTTPGSHDQRIASQGEMARRIDAFDWSRTPLGPRASWPASLATIVRFMLDSRYAMWMGWGPDLTFLYNDAYARDTLSQKHPWALGKQAREVWSEIWGDIGPRIERVLRTGEATWDEGLMLVLERSGYPEETYHTFSYSPLFDEGGACAGMFCVVTEETDRVLAERRAASLRDLASAFTAAAFEHEVFAALSRSMADSSRDLPFALAYLLDEEGGRPRLAASAGVEADSPMMEGDAWPLREVIESGKPVMVDDLRSRFTRTPRGPWDRPTHQALLLPIVKRGQAGASGVLIAGLNPLRPLDDSYRGFLDLFAGQTAAAIANARAYAEERRRAEALAELDRAKTVFFSNVSHEFRTPLTLMLGPLEEALASGDAAVTPAGRAMVDVAHRNGLRLLKLVNALLDFSRIEAGRVQARFEPTDLSALTAELASIFRSAVEKAGMTLSIDARPLSAPAMIDRDMWEKVVLNLLSNAFKYTLRGGITVSVREESGQAAVSVSDTGTGIPEAELPNIFKRFHRVQGAVGRTHEGTGIGLSLVQELVKLHGGAIDVRSRVGEGTTFTVRIPLDGAAMGAGQPAAAASPRRAEALVQEALRWVPDGGAPEVPIPATGGTDAGRIVLADDNADMREYVRRLLVGGGFDVEAVADGQEALEAARRSRPDLLLTDVMMPRLDGFGLLGAVRADPHLADTAVIMLSARAGESSRIEGLDRGADDYLVKPFSAAELLARVRANIAITRLRKATADRERELRLQAEREHERLRTVLAGIRDHFVAFDPEWRFRFVSDSWCALTGLSRERVIGTTVWELFPLAGTAWEPVARRVMSRRTPEDLEFYEESRDVWWDIRMAPTADGGLAQLAVDITERKRVEDMLRLSREQLQDLVTERTAELDASRLRLQAAERMAAIGTLSAGLGHDMGNLLLPVRVRLESLEAVSLPEDARQDVAAIKSSTDYLQKLSNGLRLLASDPSRGAREGTELHAWLSEASPVLKNVLPRGVTLETRLPERECWVAMPRAALMQAVFNLVQNAGDAMRTQRSGAVTVEGFLKDGRVNIVVGDTGPGMTDEVKRRCMEPFYTTKSRAISTGLGLSLVYGLVREAGGSVQLESTLGRGTRFTLVLPPFTRVETEGRPAKTAVVSVSDARLRALATAELKNSGFQIHLSHDHAPGAEVIVADRLDGFAAVAGKTVLLDDPRPGSPARAIGRRPRVQDLRAAVRTITQAAAKEEGR